MLSHLSHEVLSVLGTPGLLPWCDVTINGNPDNVVIGDKNTLDAEAPPRNGNYLFLKNTLYLRVNVFSRKVLIGDTIFTSRRLPFYVVIRATRGSSHLQGKGSTLVPSRVSNL